jgi:hypothetical protein
MSVILVKYLFRLSEKTRLDALAYDSKIKVAKPVPERHVQENSISKI